MNEHAEQTWPVVRTPAEAQAHDPDLPALVPLPGHLVRPIHLMINNLHVESPVGALSQGIELQLIGLAERDSSCLLAGHEKAGEAIILLARSPLQVAVEVAGAEPKPGAIVRPNLAILQGGWEDPPIVEADEDEEEHALLDGSASASEVGGHHERK